MFNNPEPQKDIENVPQFLYPISETIRLAIPTLFPSTSFIDVIKERKSSSDFKGLSIDQLSHLLWLSCKVKDIAIDSTGYILTHRPSASAGGRHPIDVLVLSPILGNSAVYYYNPFEHTLNKLYLREKDLVELQLHVNESIALGDATLLWLLAHPTRTTAKYNNAVSLIWRDAGALVHSIQLACTFLDINSCALGSLGEPYISNIFSKMCEVWSAGGNCCRLGIKEESQL